MLLVHPTCALRVTQKMTPFVCRKTNENISREKIAGEKTVSARKKHCWSYLHKPTLHHVQISRRSFIKCICIYAAEIDVPADKVFFFTFEKYTDMTC